MVGEDIHHEEDEHPLVVEDMHHVQDVHLIVGVGGKDDEQLGGCVVGVDLSVDVDGVRHPVKRGGEVLCAKVLINERSLRRKSEDEILDDRRLVEGLFLNTSRCILRFTTLCFQRYLGASSGVWVSEQEVPPPVSRYIVQSHQGDGRSWETACFGFGGYHSNLSEGLVCGENT